MSVPIVFRTGAKASRDRVIWAMTYKQAAIRAALPNPPAMGLDPRTGELVIVVPTATAATGKEALRAKLEAAMRQSKANKLTADGADDRG